MRHLLGKMKQDMGIERYDNEQRDSYLRRICYSALGQWCLHLADNVQDSRVGTTKHNQTIVLNELLHSYTDIFPCINDYFTVPDQREDSASVFIRKLYEQTGYLITNDDNRNQVANFGRIIRFFDRNLYFGLPPEDYEMNGLGVFANCDGFEQDLADYLIRDSLSPLEFLKKQYDPVFFTERDLELSEVEIFNPMQNDAPSKSWGNNVLTS